MRTRVHVVVSEGEHSNAYVILPMKWNIGNFLRFRVQGKRDGIFWDEGQKVAFSWRRNWGRSIWVERRSARNIGKQKCKGVWEINIESRQEKAECMAFLTVMFPLFFKLGSQETVISLNEWEYMWYRNTKILTWLLKLESSFKLVTSIIWLEPPEETERADDVQL